jgi:hypothetical protein
MAAAAAAVPVRVSCVDPVTVSSMIETQESFSRDGFTIIHNLITPELCAVLNDRLEAVLRGGYDKDGGRPDKVPKFSHDTRTKKGKKVAPLGGPSKRTLQIINIWKGDEVCAYLLFRPKSIEC